MKYISRQKRYGLIKKVAGEVSRIRQSGWDKCLAPFDYATNRAISIVDYILKRLAVKIRKGR